MGKTIVEKILSRAGGNPDARAGDIVNAEISCVMTNDAVAELTIQAFEQLGMEPWDNKRIAVIIDHYVPAATENAARVHDIMRRFAKKHDLRLFDMQGVCHQLMVAFIGFISFSYKKPIETRVLRVLPARLVSKGHSWG